MSRTRLTVTLLAGAALALAVLVPASARTKAAGAKYGGVLVVALTTDPSVLDPTTSANNSAIAVYGTICQRLYDRDAKFRLVPLLAAAVPVRSKDKLSYTIELRKGVRFNDGTPFDAQAVVTTVQRMMTYPGSLRTSDFAAVESIRASGPYTVRYHLKTQDGTFNGGNPFVLSPTQLEKLGDNFGANPVCVGPFMFDHRVAGDHVTVIKSPYYYDAKNVYLDKIVYKPMSDAAAAAAALKAGDIQVLTQVSSTELEAVRRSSSLRVISSPQLGYWGIIFNVGNTNGMGNLPYANSGKPFAKSAKLRQAFEEAIDRDTLNKVVFGGLYQVSCTPIPPADTPWFEATKVPCTPYNPEHARKLVAEWGLGFLQPTVHLLTSTGTDQLRLAQFIQAQEEAVGINVVIDTSTAITGLSESGNFESRFGGWVPGGPDPHVLTYQHLHTLGARNYGGYSTPRLDQILSNGLKATNKEARSTLYRVAQEIIHENRPIIYLYNPVTFAGFSTKVTGVQLTYSGGVRVENARYK